VVVGVIDVSSFTALIVARNNVPSIYPVDEDCRKFINTNKTAPTRHIQIIVDLLLTDNDLVPTAAVVPHVRGLRTNRRVINIKIIYIVIWGCCCDNVDDEVSNV
jgi:hypothetical protein